MVRGEAAHGCRDDKLVCVAIENAPGDECRGVVGHVGHDGARGEVIPPGKSSQGIAVYPGSKGPRRRARQTVAGAAGVEADNDALVLAIKGWQALEPAQPVTEAGRLLPTDASDRLVVAIEGVALDQPRVMGGLVLPELSVGGLGARNVESTPQFNRVLDFVGAASGVPARCAHCEGVECFY